MVSCPYSIVPPIYDLMTEFVFASYTYLSRSSRSLPDYWVTTIFLASLILPNMFLLFSLKCSPVFLQVYLFSASAKICLGLQNNKYFSINCEITAKKFSAQNLNLTTAKLI